MIRRPSPGTVRLAYVGVEELQREFAAKEGAIRARLEEFRAMAGRPEEELFPELCFCILAIQTKGRAADAAVRGLLREGLLWNGDATTIARFLHHRVRFHNHKAAYIVAARGRFFRSSETGLRSAIDAHGSPQEARRWLVHEVDGLGWKEASHFLRNIGHGEDLAILDRHVMANLVRHRVLGRPPRSLTARRYLGIEERMRAFAQDVGIALGALDLVFWSRETGEIFK
jgi:N-glycosylase/DNA lyase